MPWLLEASMDWGWAEAGLVGLCMSSHEGTPTHANELACPEHSCSSVPLLCSPVPFASIHMSFIRASPQGPPAWHPAPQELKDAARTAAVLSSSKVRVPSWCGACCCDGGCLGSVPIGAKCGAGWSLPPVASSFFSGIVTSAPSLTAWRSLQATSLPKSCPRPALNAPSCVSLPPRLHK